MRRWCDEHDANKIVDIRVSGGGSSRFRVHLHHSHLQLVFMKTQMSLVKGFFALFPNLLKCGVRSPPDSESARQSQLIHASSSAASL